MKKQYYHAHPDYGYCIVCGTALYETAKATSYDVLTGVAVITRFRRCPSKKFWNSHADLEYSDILGWHNRYARGGMW